jgi:hypothetical protein
VSRKNLGLLALCVLGLTMLSGCSPSTVVFGPTNSTQAPGCPIGAGSCVKRNLTVTVTTVPGSLGCYEHAATPRTGGNLRIIAYTRPISTADISYLATAAEAQVGGCITHSAVAAGPSRLELYFDPNSYSKVDEVAGWLRSQVAAISLVKVVPSPGGQTP